VLCLLWGRPALAADTSSISAFTTKTQSVLPGETIVFEVGITPTDNAVWDLSTVGITIELVGPSGAVVQTSDPVVPTEEIAPGRTTPIFVKVKIADVPGGAYTARANVLRSGKLVDVSEGIAIAIGTVVAKAAGAAPGTALHATITGNDSLQSSSSQAGDLSLQAKFAGDRSAELKAGVANPAGGSQPVVTYSTPGTTTQFGTYSLALDDGVLSGPSGTGITIKRQWGSLHSLQFGYLSGGHGTENPFNLYGLAYNMPIRAGTLSFTAGWVSQSGPASTSGANDFIRRGELLGLIYRHPANDAGFSYQGRFGLINYFDEVSQSWRADRALDLQTGFRVLKWDWTFDYNRAGPYYPTLTASGASPDREAEALTGSRTFGPLKISLKVDGNRTALNGSPSIQTGHVWDEGVGLGYTFHSHDTLQLDLSNAINHVLAQTPTASLNQNTALSYSATRGKTGIQISIGTATSQDTSGTTSHTITDSLNITRSLWNGINLSSSYSYTGNLGNAASATSIGHQAGLKADWAIGPMSVSTGYDWSFTQPFAGVASPSTRGVNFGLGFKPKYSTTALQASVTRSQGATGSTVGRVNLSRQY
jgi:hypothetical protein